VLSPDPMAFSGFMVPSYSEMFLISSFTGTEYFRAVATPLLAIIRKSI
jgi:hypothetical protein